MGASFQLFNLDTMSGVFPGTRTLVFQRVRLRPLAAPDSPSVWARLLWYDDPAACVVELNEPPPAPVRTLLRIPDPHGADFGARLQAGLAAAGFALFACGACAHWQPLAATTPDRLATGLCTWTPPVVGAQTSSSAPPVPGAQTSSSAPPVPGAQTSSSAPPAKRAEEDVCGPGSLAAQSLLALDCLHWQAAPAQRLAPLAAQDQGELPPISKRAERESDERWSWWGRLRRAWRRRPAPDSAGPSAPQSWEDRIVERSGVGAGTEPCFACQGRIANLGALAVASPEGDKQTYSVWRCRQCYTWYLNDWIDRWERTDSLETEETYYRLAPQEALEILSVIEGVAGAEHPARRHERGAQRAWMQQFLGDRPALSHQIKQGR